MNSKEIFEDLNRYGKDNENNATVQKYLRYFKEGYDAYGLNHEQVDFKVKEILAMQGLTQDLILETSLLLVQ